MPYETTNSSKAVLFHITFYSVNPFLLYKKIKSSHNYNANIHTTYTRSKFFLNFFQRTFIAALQQFLKRHQPHKKTNTGSALVFKLDIIKSIPPAHNKGFCAIWAEVQNSSSFFQFGCVQVLNFRSLISHTAQSPDTYVMPHAVRHPSSHKHSQQFHIHWLPLLHQNNDGKPILLFQ